MKNIVVKKFTSFFLIFAIIFTMVLGMSMTTALAADVNLTPGPTVIKDPNSPTGYTVHFVYVDATATRIQLNVGAYKNFADPTDTKVYTPFEYFPGCMRGGGTYTMEMTKVDDSHWVADVPLSGGVQNYSFMRNGNSQLLKDPANPPLWAPDGMTGPGGTDRTAFNKVNVPADPVKQNFQPTIEKALYENPRPDSQKGTWGYVALPTQISGKTRYVGVYLPPNYDPNRAQPYKTIYLQHGGAQDASDWMNIGSAPTIMDNLLMDGLTEPAVVVTTDSTYMGAAPYSNLTNIIIPFIESNYNVSKYMYDRAFAGLSAGASLTADIIKTDSSMFGYYGIFSGMGCPATVRQGKNLNLPFMFFGFGLFEDTTGSRASEINALADTNINYKSVMVAGAHDFHTWTQLFTKFAKDYLWRPAAFKDQSSVVTTAADKVQAGDTFDVNTSLLGQLSSNAAQFNYTFDARKFEYVGFKPADGVTVLNSQIGKGTVNFSVMAPDYNMQKLGTLTLKAKADVTFANEWNTLSLTASCAVKSDSGSKSIVPISGNVSFTTIGVKGDTNADGKVNLLDLSNLIDWFGKTSADSQWNGQYAFFDYNNNGQIDISDISLVAQML